MLVHSRAPLINKRIITVEANHKQ